jgi:Secretion system C-terminal sorting domain
MKKNLHNLKLLGMVLVVMLMTSIAQAATRTASVTGNWNVAATWGGAAPPVAGDDVIINNGISVTVIQNEACATITFRSASGTLTVNGGFTLTVSAGIILEGSNTINTAATITGAGSITCATLQAGGIGTLPTADRTTVLTSTINSLTTSGNLTVRSEDNVANQVNATLNIGSGTITVGATVVLDADDDGGGGTSTATLSLNTGAGSGTLAIAGATAFSTPSIGTVTVDFNGATATVNYTGAAQTVRATAYRNLGLSGSGTKTMTGVATINGNLVLGGSASATAAGALNIGGDVTLGSGTTFNASTFSHTVSGNWVNNGATFTAGTSTITLDGTTQSIGGSASSTFNNLTINGGPSTVTLGVNCSLVGDLNITTNDVLNMSTFSFNRTAAGGTITIAGTLRLAASSGGAAGSNFPNNYTAWVMTNGTVIYDGSNAITQTVFASPAYNNLILTNGTGSGVANKDMTAANVVNGTMTVNANVVFTPAALVAITGTTNTITGSGTIKVTRIIATPSYLFQYVFNTNTLTNMTVDYAGAGAQTVNPFTYGNLITSGSGTKTAGGIMDVNGSVTIGTGTILTGGTFTHNVGGDWINNGTFTANTSTVNMNGGTQTIDGTVSTTFNNLTINGTPSTTSLAINTSIVSDLNITANDIFDLNTFSCNRTAGGGTLTVAGTMRLGADAGGQTGSNYPTNFTANTLTGTVEYDGSNAITQTVYATPAYETLILTNGTGSGSASKITTANLTVNTTLTVNTGAVLSPAAANTVGGTTNTINGTGTIQVTRIIAAASYTGQYTFTTNTLTNLIVDYAGLGAQSVSIFNMGSLLTSGSGVKSMLGAVGIANNVSVGGGTTLDMVTFQITLSAGSVVSVNGILDFTNAGGGSIRTGNNVAATLTMGSAGLIRTSDIVGLGPLALASLQPQGTGTWTLTSIDNNGTVEYNAGAAQVITDRNYNNLTISNSTGTKTWTLAATRTVNGTITISANAPLTFAGGQTILLKGDWMKNSSGTFTPGTTVVSFNGAALQTIGGTTSTTFSNVSINNSSIGVNLLAQPFVTTNMTFIDGVVFSFFPNILTFNDNATVTGASDNSFVDGPVTKVGDDAFRFPIGLNGFGYHYTEISAPSNVAHTFSSQYIRASGTALGPITATGLLNVSNCEYWFINRNVGNSTPDIRLSWTPNSPCNSNQYITNLSGLTIASFNGTNWVTHAGNGTTGDINTGDVVRNAVPGTVWSAPLSIFTLGNTLAGANSLPVKFGDIKAYEKQSGIQIDWTSYQEVNLSNYVIQRSADGHTWTEIGTVAALNLQRDTKYGFFDPAPLAGVSFYRIRNVDLDGKSGFSNIVRVNLDKNVKDITLYPNPVRANYISFQSSDLSRGNYSVRIYNGAGQVVVTQSFNHNGGAINKTIQLPTNIQSGMYSIQVDNDGVKVMNRTFMVQK